MKYILKINLLNHVAVAVILFAASNAVAQHCPFDGGHMIVVQLTDAEDKPLFGSAADLTLQELGNPDADWCNFTSGLISRAFLPPVDAFMHRYGRHGFENFRTYCEDCAFNADGFYAVVLGQSERTCMIKKPDGMGPDKYVSRKFEVRYSRDGVEQTIAVPPERIYSMCNGNGKWSRFQPIKLRLEPKCEVAVARTNLPSPVTQVEKAALPTGEASLRQKFDPLRDPAADLEAALVIAKKEKKHIILDIGGEWCIWCHILDKYITSEPAITKLVIENYVWLKINMCEENENKVFLSAYPEIVGYPHLFVLDSDGKLLHSQNTEPLESEKSYDNERFSAFLTKWAPKQANEVR